MLWAFIEDILMSFKWYRRRKGGTWYKVADMSDAGGMQSATIFWTRERPTDFNQSIIAKEQY